MDGDDVDDNVGHDVDDFGDVYVGDDDFGDCHDHQRGHNQDL